MKPSTAWKTLDWLHRNRVDLVLTDVRMPVMDGLALMQQLHAEGESATEVIVVSGHDDFKYAQQAIRLGAFDYLLKPVEPGRSTDAWTVGCGEREIGRKTATPPLLPGKRCPRGAGDPRRPGRHARGGTLKEAAEKVHLNACYLSQLFKQKTGQNFVEYVTDLRMKEAEKLLSGTILRIYEIADRLGFSDISYLTTCFKKHSGCTLPSFANAICRLHASKLF